MHRVQSSCFCVPKLRTAPVAFVSVACASIASGAIVHVTGDLGSPSFPGSGTTAPVNSSSTIPFIHSVPGVGDIAGDLIASNVLNAVTGTQDFSLVLTNLVFQCFVANPLPPTFATQVRIVALENFVVSGTGSAGVSHALSGTASGSNSAAALASTTFDFGFANVTPPSLFGGTTSPGVPNSFSDGPFGGTVPTTHPFFTIRMQLDLAVSGTGFINLPSSYDANATVVPVPAGIVPALALFGLAFRRTREA